MISQEDVLSVAGSLVIQDLSREEVEWIISTHGSYQENDPSGTWDLVVEQQIDEVIESRGTPFYLK